MESYYASMHLKNAHETRKEKSFMNCLKEKLIVLHQNIR